MLGPKDQPKLHARAMETLYVFFLIVTRLEQFADSVPHGRLYLKAALALQE